MKVLTSLLYFFLGKLIVTCSDDCSVIVWDPKTASILHKFSSDDGRFHSGPVTTLAINFDNQLVLTGSQDASARLIHIGNGKIIGKLESHSESVEAVAFCQAMPLMVTGDVDGTIHIWDTAAMRVRHSVKHDVSNCREMSSKGNEPQLLLSVCSTLSVHNFNRTQSLASSFCQIPRCSCHPRLTALSDCGMPGLANASSIGRDTKILCLIFKQLPISAIFYLVLMIIVACCFQFE